MSGQITLDASTLAPSDQVTLLLDVLSGLANVQSLTLSISEGDLPTEVGQTAQLVCSGSLWGSMFNAIAVSVTLGENGLYSDVTLTIELPFGEGWTFATAFPSLPTFGALAGILGEGEPASLDGISMSSAVLVFSTEPGTCVLANGQNVEYYYGCGFAGVLTASGQDFSTSLGLVGKRLTCADTLVICGQIWPEATVPILPPGAMPWDELPAASAQPWTSPTTYSGIYLSIALGAPFSLPSWSVQLGAPVLYLYSPLSTEWMKANPTYRPALALGVDVQDSSTGLDAAFYIESFGSDSVLLSVDCNFNLADGLELASVLNLMGVSDSTSFSTQIPDQLSSAATGAGLILYSVAVAFDESFKVTLASVTVGIETSSGMSINTGTLPNTGSLPLKTVLFSISVCGDQFDFTVMSQFEFLGSVPLFLQLTYDTGDDFSLLAQMVDPDGTLSLAGILSELNLTLPTAVTQLAISDAMVEYSLQKGSDRWSLAFAVGDESADSVPVTPGSVTLDIRSIRFFMNSHGDWGLTGEVSTSSGCVYTGTLSDTNQVTTINAGVVMPPEGISFDDLLKDLGFPPFDLPFDGSIVSIRGYFCSDGPSYGFELGLALGDGTLLDALYVRTEFAGTPWWGFSVDLDLDVDLFDFQALRNWVSGNSLVLDSVQYVYSCSDLTIAQVSQVNQIIGDLSGGTPFTQLPAANLASGSNLNVTVTLNGKPSVVFIPLSDESQPSQGEGAAGPGGTTPLTWIPYQQQIGPLSLQTIGFAFSDNVLQMGVSAQAQLGALSIDVAGLSVAFDVSQSLDPTFSIEGLEIDYRSGGVTAAGMLAVNPAPTAPLVEEYDGGLIIETEKFDLSAIGSWGVLSSGDYSFFAMAAVQGDFGGPPPFFVTGLCAGFGVNRTLVAPPIAQVAQFPLVTVAAGGPVPPLPSLQSELDAYVAPQEGTFWLAAGISFTSFGVVDGTLLLALVDGPQVEVDLFGEAGIVLPSSDQGQPNSYVNAVLGIEATYVPAAGSAMLQGQLTASSYVMDPSCHLGGGFAVGGWFGDSPYAGDFVVTLGGYNPNYDAPTYYPSVPKLTVNWAEPNSPLSITGSAYFAVVPHCLMLGFEMNAVWSSGSVTATFQSESDFVFTWAPFTYKASVAVSFTVVARIDLHVTTLDVHATIGAGLSVWGPPFGGNALIDLSVFSFTLGFGSSYVKPPALTWDEFDAAFLPGGQQQQATEFVSRMPGLMGGAGSGSAGAISIAVTAGNLTTGTQAASGLTLVSAENAQFAVALSNPATTISFSDFSNDPGPLETGVAIGITPMQLSSVQSAVTVSISGSQPTAASVSAITGSVPKSLWYYDASNPIALNGDSMLDGALVGADIVPQDATEFTFAAPQGPYPTQVLCLDGSKSAKVTWNAPFDPPDPNPWQGLDPIETLTAGIGSQSTTAARSAVLSELAAAGFAVPTMVNVAPLADPATVMLPDSFTLCELGSS